jgi:hypothetical protein
MKAIYQEPMVGASAAACAQNLKSHEVNGSKFYGYNLQVLTSGGLNNSGNCIAPDNTPLPQ